MAVVAVAKVNEVGMVAEEARATLVPVRHQRVDFARHSTITSSTMDTRQLQIKCAPLGRSSYNM